ncbi:MAG: ArsA-related P-loop ATPase, partial [Acidilobaceae archaeon]
FKELGLRMRGVVINQVYPPWLLDDPRAPDYLKKRIVTQKPYIREIVERFRDLIVAVIPMQSREPKGLEAIKFIGDELWNSSIDISVLEALGGR